jgi:hypothetical protein
MCSATGIHGANRPTQAAHRGARGTALLYLYKRIFISWIARSVFVVAWPMPPGVDGAAPGLRSAYPAAIVHLPCPLHTRWEHKPHAKQLPEDGFYLAKVSFSHPDGPWCGLPFRRNGGLFWPLQGTGWYWSPEIRAAQCHLHADIVVRDLWIACQQCDCQSCNWIDHLYEERRRIGSKTRGYPLKLGLNSLYGKMAQRCGRGPYHDAVAAGLITAITRAGLSKP